MARLQRESIYMCVCVCVRVCINERKGRGEENKESTSRGHLDTRGTAHKDGCWLPIEGVKSVSVKVKSKKGVGAWDGRYLDVILCSLGTLGTDGRLGSSTCDLTCSKHTYSRPPLPLLRSLPPHHSPSLSLPSVHILLPTPGSPSFIPPPPPGPSFPFSIEQHHHHHHLVVSVPFQESDPSILLLLFSPLPASPPFFPSLSLLQPILVLFFVCVFFSPSPIKSA
ncbi:hypothetical protein LY78DRAFT_278005 [Colletotrichum sublineola]|nr:hypothetical protein LY78DRAFT_278005 [Colletotrichum sublineola]